VKAALSFEQLLRQNSFITSVMGVILNSGVWCGIFLKFDFGLKTHFLLRNCSC